MELLWALYEDGALHRERVFRDRLNPMDISDERLLQHYRMPRQEILQLCEEISPEICRETKRTQAIPVHTQVLVALRFYASGTFQNVIGDVVGLSQASISRVVNNVTNALFNKSRRDIKMTRNHQELTQIRQDFHAIAAFPSVIGVIDCTHVAIKAPENEFLYLNSKKNHTINIQVVTDSKMRILSFCAKYPGSVHDSFIWSHSFLRQQFMEGQFGNSFLLGDSGYPLEQFLMTPVNQPSNAAEHRFNESHTQTWIVIKKTFGILKTRFRCLHVSGGSLKYQPQKCAKIATVCMMLHNICVNRGIPLEEGLLDNDDPVTEPHAGDGHIEEAHRRNLINSVFSQVKQVT